ncbi:MAG: Ig-like domain-containing protein [Propionibacteriaceae bacterium]|nr:Ig-like domain-containing protein [Propionibacteriaceae bacterium]
MKGVHVFRNLVPTVVVLTCVSVVVSLAVAAQGNSVQRPELNNSAIWASNDADGWLGRFNKAASAMELTVSPSQTVTHSVDVLQDGNTVVGWDRTSGTLVSIDAAGDAVDYEDALQLPAAAQVELRGGTLAVLDVTAGAVRAIRTEGTPGFVNLNGLDEHAPALASVGGPAALSVSSDGTVVAASTSGTVVSILAEGRGFTDPLSLDLHARLATVSVAGLGHAAVVLDSTAGILYLPGGRTAQVCDQPTDEICATLQQGGADTGAVMVATDTDLVKVRFDGSVTTVSTGQSGAPATPVAVAGCVYAAWAGDVGEVVQSCGDAPAQAQSMDPGNPAHPNTALLDPVFRENFGQLLLNDRATGRIFDMAMNQSVDQWPAPDQAKDETNQDAANTKSSSSSVDPQAVDDEFSVRASRTSVLHVLDNDSDPNGGILAIVSVDSQPSGGASAVVAPDGQTILYTQPAKGGDATFSYTISNVAGQIASAMVTVTADGPTDNTVPAMRESSSGKEQKYVVASGGSVSIPVANQYRDEDCDPITVVSAQVSVASQGTAMVTSNGMVKFLAPTTSVDVTATVGYVVTDGFDPSGAGQFSPVAGSISVMVLGTQDTTGVAPVANPDFVSGVVGQPLPIHPLANDIPGVDPGNPGMTVSLAADVEMKSGLSSVVTDRAAGVVTVTGAKAGTYVLSYTAAFGSAPTDASTIRVDIRDPSDQGREPVAVPDQAVVRGQAPAMVDVLANDSDPQGKLLTVQTATPADPDALSVAIVQGRWVRILPLEPVLPQNPTSVLYQITNGDQVYVTGSITVTQLPALAVDAPLVSDDWATVRAGDSVLIPVLANDTSQGGSPLSLVTNIPGVTTGMGGLSGAGELPVVNPAVAVGNDPGDVGSAYVSGSFVRYVAPAQVESPTQVQVTYYAQTATSTPVSATVTVTIVPAPSPTNPDSPPDPTLVEVRAVAGDQITIPVPSWGQDPDGDSVQLVGLASAPELGRVLSFTPDGIVYQAYPSADACGTDSFTYILSDQYGLTGVGRIRVAITPPGPTQPPMGVDDVVIAAPDAQVAVDVMANDFLAASDQVTIVNVSEPGTLVGPSGPIQVTAGDDHATITVNYDLQGNSDQRGHARLIVTSQEGFVNPPVAANIVADVAGGVATADVLARASDPDSDPATLAVAVLNDPTATVSQGVVRIAQKPVPQIITYRLTDREGGASAALIYVPAANDGLPYGVGSITIHQDSSEKFSLDAYVKSSRDAPVRITIGATMTATPATDVSVTMWSTTGFQVTSSNGYVGPAAVSMEVTDGTSLTDPNGRRAVVSIPVQVGPATPVLYCPDAAQVVQVGTTASVVDLTSLCHVWVPDTLDSSSLTYAVAWASQPKDVSVAMTPDHRAMQLSALGTAHAQDTGALTVSIEGTVAAPATVNVVVRDAMKPTIAPIVATTSAGKPATGTIALSSTLANGRHDTIVSIEPRPGTSQDAQASGAGSPTWTVTPPSGFHGVLTYALVVSDVADATATGRQVGTTLTVTVVDVPDAPSGLVTGSNAQAGSIRVSWTAPNANGARIETYVMADEQGAQWTCAATSCLAQPLAVSSTYRFHVRAVNSVGPGPWSEWSGSVATDTTPTPVTGFHASDPKDRAITLTWDAMTSSTCGCSVSGLTYMISWPGGSKEGITGTSITLTGLTNEQTSFTIWAVNAQGRSKSPTTTQGWPSGAPVGLTVDKPTASEGSIPVVTVSWSLDSANGEGPVRYWVSDNDTPIPACQGITATHCQQDSIAFNGDRHQFQVIATNKPEQYPTSATVSWIAHGVPPQISSLAAEPTGDDSIIHVKGKAPASRGPAQTSYVEIWVDGAMVKSLPVYDANFEWTGPSPSGNGTTASVTTKVCYTTADGPVCGPASSPVSVTPYGDMKDLSLTVTVEDNHMNVVATANANGAQATLKITNSGTETGCDKSTSGAAALTITCSITVEWKQSRTFSATVTSTTTSRPSLSTSKDGVVGPPPAMEIVSLAVTADGSKLTATAVGNAHGIPAILTVAVWGNATCTGESTGKGSGTITSTITCDVGYRVYGTFTATMSDDSSFARANVSKSATGRGADAPMTLDPITIQANSGGMMIVDAQGDPHGNYAQLTMGASPGTCYYSFDPQVDTTPRFTRMVCYVPQGVDVEIRVFLTAYSNGTSQPATAEVKQVLTVNSGPTPTFKISAGSLLQSSATSGDWYSTHIELRGFYPNNQVGCGNSSAGWYTMTTDSDGNASGTGTSAFWLHAPSGDPPPSADWTQAQSFDALGYTCYQK